MLATLVCDRDVVAPDRSIDLAEQAYHVANESLTDAVRAGDG